MRYAGSEMRKPIWQPSPERLAAADLRYHQPCGERRDGG